MNYKTMIVVFCLAAVGISAAFFWRSSRKFVSLATPAMLSASVPANASSPGRDGSRFLDSAIRHWPRFSELVRVSQHPGFFVERKTNDYWIVSIGDRLSNRFHSWAMLRVWKSGLIEKVDISTGTWAMEFRPGGA